MRSIVAALLAVVGICSISSGARAEQPSCKICAEQQKACMKNYAGPACKTEYQMCLKSCKK